MNIRKINSATRYIIRDGAELLGCNIDAIGPDYKIACGTIVAMLEYSTSTKAEIAGKPSRLLFDYCVEKHGIDKEKTIMIGDQMDTDIQYGKNNGIDTCLLLTGCSKIINNKLYCNNKQYRVEEYPSYIMKSL